MMTLEQATAYFESHRQGWLDSGHEGEWAVVRAEQFLGFYPSLKAAYERAVREWGADGEFLLKQIIPPDAEVETIQRVDWGSACGRGAAF